MKRTHQQSELSATQRFTRSDEDGGDRRTSQRAERAIEHSACASDASFKLRGASARHPLQHLSGLRGDLVLAQHLVLRSDRLGH